VKGYRSPASFGVSPYSEQRQGLIEMRRQRA
jgi:hypothetical protein